MNVTRNVLLIFIVLVLCASTLQQQMDLIHSHKLAGAYTPAPEPVFSDSTWFDGSYQAQKTVRLKERVGFHDDFVRLYNQIDFSLFGLSHAYGIVVGKEKYLYYVESIFNHSGKNRLSPAYYPMAVQAYKELQQYLMDQYGIPLIWVIAPNKADFFPEYIPDRYLRDQQKETKYSSYVKYLEYAQADYIDFNNYFLLMKDTSSYNLYPKNGSHWSSFGAVLAFDSLSRWLQQGYTMKMGKRILDTIISSQELNDDHGDLSRTMNLIWEPSHPSMDYATYYYDVVDSTERPNVLFVGDSFFWQWYYPGIIGNNFNRFQFWYYNQGVYPGSFTKYQNAYTFDLLQEIQKYDVIILLQTAGGYMNIGHGFVERAYCEFFYKEKFDTYINQIKSSPEWYGLIQQKSIDKGLPVETLLCQEATYCLFAELKKQK